MGCCLLVLVVCSCLSYVWRYVPFDDVSCCSLSVVRCRMLWLSSVVCFVRYRVVLLLWIVLGCLLVVLACSFVFSAFGCY